MKAELAQLIALQNADSNIRSLQTEIESIPERRAEIEKEFDQRAFEIRAMEERRDNARQERTRLEAEIFEQKQRAERADRNLMAAKSPTSTPPQFVKPTPRVNRYPPLKRRCLSRWKSLSRWKRNWRNAPRK